VSSRIPCPRKAKKTNNAIKTIIFLKKELKLYLKLSYALAILFRENKISAENVVHFFHIRRNTRKNYLLSVISLFIIW